MLTENDNVFQKMTSNWQDWIDFGQYVQNAVAAAIQSIGVQNAPEIQGIQQRMEEVFE